MSASDPTEPDRAAAIEIQADMLFYEWDAEAPFIKNIELYNKAVDVMAQCISRHMAKERKEHEELKSRYKKLRNLGLAVKRTCEREVCRCRVDGVVLSEFFNYISRAALQEGK